ncbi:hypothetical protein [Reinekea marinisedimentorum]|uniref:Endo-alpha(1,4)-fucoidanase Mef1 domain-containing protein n=1 Tax=Reinekea marinisedimentorum TaxID=230495 RepID=A0A4R3I6R5_9GAMM|nr:hypothetical protein [Reinekea marinisedimentorum]TCS41785.1 hypothetical protein BCF53_105213 [Reinekea marinisedimentorum]
MIRSIKLDLSILFVATFTLSCNSDFSQLEVDNLHSENNASWLAGSWGVTQRVDGGYKLDESAVTSDWVSGAEEIVSNLPSAGHVITSLTHPAHAFLFTVRENNNIDVAAIHPDMVPEIGNEQIIFDVIDVYRSAGKKVILYLNTAGPSMIEDTDPDNEIEIKAAWEDYYESEWDGDEGAAWRHLVLGYVERFDGLVDGYWLDNVNNLPGKLSDFIATLRSVDPTWAIAINDGKEYFTDDAGDYLYVDTDGVDDEDERDYKIVKHEVINEYMDFTGGHITPLGQGAPPNSWAYEEYTIPDMVETPWDTYDGINYALKHAWFPIRKTWSNASSDLVFEEEQAYRFTRTIIDAFAGITWSTTQVDGYMSTDEMDIMLEIEYRLSQVPKVDYTAYERPEGAYLVGEDLQ